MGLFDKKYCDICGEKIGLLGNKKLEDGNLCKNCASKLSPWFDERRHSTVAQIKEQLAYREANRSEVESFHTTRTLGRTTKVLLDEDAHKFMVTRARDLREANPDVLNYDQVTGCDLDVIENKTEEMREIKDREGHTQRQSYNPPRYKYSYDFKMIITVNNPYFNEIRFNLNDSSVQIDQNRNNYGNTAYGNGNMGGRNMNRTLNNQQNAMNAAMATFGNALGQALNNNANQNNDPRMSNPEYQEYYNMGMEIKEALLQIRTQVRDDIAAANAPKTAVTCPYCGATTIPDAQGKCEFCGGAIKG